MNPFSIKDQVIVIVGGTGAIGSSFAEHLLLQQARIVVLGRNQTNMDKQIYQLKKIATDRVVGYCCDALVEEDLKAVKEKVLERWGRIDTLINAVGGNVAEATIGENESFFDMKMKDFKTVTELNLDGAVLPTLVFGEAIARQKKGSILNISSMAATQAITRVLGYSTSKSAIESFTKWLAIELALKLGDKVRVNAIAPGFFIGNQNRNLLLNDDGSLTQRGKIIIQNTPMKRFGSVEELNGVVQWLISDAASFVTGTVIPIDGGFCSFSGV